MSYEVKSYHLPINHRENRLTEGETGCLSYNTSIMAEEKNKGGRPPLTPEEKNQKIQEMSQKLEPYLKSGLSVRKALAEAQISKDMFYRMMDEDEGFRDKIDTFKNFVSVLLNNTLIRELQSIIEKQNGNETKGIKPQRLDAIDIGFLKWFALNSNSTKEEWGERKDVTLFDPETEIQKVKKMIEENFTTEISHLEDNPTQQMGII